MTSANDTQVGGSHYKKPIQHWDFAAANYGPGYFRGNATKYLVRWRDKNGIEDLKKARHYVQKLIEVDWHSLGWRFDSIPHYSPDARMTITERTFVEENKIESQEGWAINWITTAPTPKSLEVVLNHIDAMIEFRVKELQVETLR